VPLAVAEVGAEIADVAARLVTEGGNPNLKGDAIAAVLLAEAGVRATTALVKINLSTAGLEDERLNRADELADTAAAARQAVEGVE
jgi:formiminotetrahydrofolate cyclodeaminase